MIKIVFVSLAIIFSLTNISYADNENLNEPTFKIFKKLKQRFSKSGCRVSGLNWKSSHPKLKSGLCRASKVLGPVQVTSTCRTKSRNSGAKRSYHLYSRGCKAADIRIKGISKRKILRWWNSNYKGGKGLYLCRSFVHVDVGPKRSWTWNLCKKKRRRKRK